MVISITIQSQQRHWGALQLLSLASVCQIGTSCANMSIKSSGLAKYRRR